MSQSSGEIRLGDLAHARSGDKGSSANVGVVANSPAAYRLLVRELTSDRVAAYFLPLRPKSVVRYDLPNLESLNFVLVGVLDGGGSRSLRVDSQGKALGQAILEMRVPVAAAEAAELGADFACSP